MKAIFLLLCACFHLHADPLDWMEQESSPQLQQWLESQAQNAQNYFDNCQEPIENFDKLAAYASQGLPTIRPNGLYFLKRDEGEEYPSLVFQDLDQNHHLLISPSGNHTSVTDFRIDPQGKVLTYSLSLSGSDQEVWKILDLTTLTHYPEVLEGILFTHPIWSKTDQTLYYLKHNHQLYAHTLGTSQDKDTLLYEWDSNQIFALVSDIVNKERTLVLSVHPIETMRQNAIVLFDLNTGSLTTCLHSGQALNQYVDELDGKLLIITDHEANLQKLIAIDLNDVSKQETLLPESPMLLHAATLCADKIVATYYKAAVANLFVYDAQGKFIRKLALPGNGSVTASGKSGHPFLFYAYTDFTTPSQLLKVDVDRGVTTRFFTPTLTWNPKDYTTTQIFYPSADGTEIPLFLSHQKDLIIDENTPLLLYGYGGFGISINPFFRPLHLAWMNQGGVYAVANIRGGYEFGRSWHNAGKLHQKQNCFDDFISAATWLHDNRIGSPKTTGIIGKSNGGLLTGACVTQRPDLFGAVIVDRGVLDMLRFDQFTVGHLWCSEYGNPANPEDRDYLLTYSPYHNATPGTNYPATLIHTADHDDRVVPMHSYKFTSALQSAQASRAPILLKVTKEAGHGKGEARSQALAVAHDMLLFLKRELQS